MAWLDFRCTHRYPSGFLLDVAFSLERPFVALFGPSGSGKTSILGMIAGFVRPQQGRICQGDRTLLDTESGLDLGPERRRIGMVYQDFLLFPHLRVEDNLRYGQSRRTGDGRKIDFQRVVEVLEIGPLLRRWPENLSGGERQRVALGRALLSGPHLLLMDEPLASLDLALRIRILTYLDRLVSEWGIPTLFVTHSQADVRRAAQWVVLMERGRVVASGPPEEALIRPEPMSWSNAAGPVNLLRLDSVQAEGTTHTARIGNQTLFLPPVPESCTPRFVQFSPKDVVLARRDVPGLSARNHLQGRVCQRIQANQAVFVAVDIGQIVWSEVTPASEAELELTTGAEVVCLVKVHSLQLVE